MIDLKSGDIKNSDKLAFLLFSFLKNQCFFDYPRGTKSPEKSKDITVLIPCYGKAETIERAVKSALNQTMKPFQVLVLLMDEESKAKKNDLEILEKSVKCVESERLNVCAARNKLAELCPTEYFIFLDGDDELSGNYIEEVYKAPASIVFTPCKFSEEGIKDIEFDIFMKDKNVFLDNNFTSLFHKTAFKEVGGFDEKYKYGLEDTDIMLKLLLLQEYDISFTTKTFFYYNESATGLTKSKNFYDSCLLGLNEYLQGFKKDYGWSSWVINPVVFKFLQSCKDELSVEDLKEFFNKELKRDVDEMDGEEFTAATGKMLQGGVREKQKASFALDLKCNDNCPYCGQGRARKSCKFLSEDEIYENFDRAITYCENLLGYPPTIHILGGEPTLWSDELVAKIQKRIERYGIYIVFSNGYNKNSLFWKDPNARVNWHITDWEKMEKITPPERCEFDVKIIVTKKNIHLVDQYLKLNKDVRIFPSFCHGAGKEFDLDLDDIKKLAEIEYENRDFMDIRTRVNLNFYENYLRHGFEAMQKRCKTDACVWNFLCYENTVLTCCADNGETYKLEDFKGQTTRNCGDCFMFY